MVVTLGTPLFVLDDQYDYFDEYEPVLAHKVGDEKNRKDQPHDFDEVAHINFLCYKNEVLVYFFAFFGIIQRPFLSRLNIKVDERLKEFDAHVKL